MTSFDHLVGENLEEAQVFIGTGYTRTVFRGLEVTAWWFRPWEIDTREFEADELSEPC